jgi:hypothetical protein
MLKERDMGNLRDSSREQIDVVQREPDFSAGFLASGLHRRASRNHDQQSGAEVGEDVGNRRAEAIAVGEQHDHRCDSPRHAQHSERGAAPVVAHGVVGFLEQIADHG